MKKVAVLGASAKPDRYSYKAVESLKKHGYDVIPINTAEKVILGIQSIKSLRQLDEPIHTLTVYVNPSVSEELADDFLNTDAERIIFNPGTENPELMRRLEEKGTEVLQACTLVMLATNQF